MKHEQIVYKKIVYRKKNVWVCMKWTKSNVFFCEYYTMKLQIMQEKHRLCRVRHERKKFVKMQI